MAIKGSLKEASLPDVLQLLALGQKTGCLSIGRPLQLRLHLLRQGPHLLRVDREPPRPARRHPRQAREDLAGPARTPRSTARPKSATRSWAKSSWPKRLITQQDLERTCALQIEESVYYLFTWTQGTFNFEADVRPEQQDFLVSINPESLLLEGARRVDEWSLIEKKIPSFDLIFVLDRDRLAISDAKMTETRTGCCRCSTARATSTR